MRRGGAGYLARTSRIGISSDILRIRSFTHSAAHGIGPIHVYSVVEIFSKEKKTICSLIFSLELLLVFFRPSCCARYAAIIAVLRFTRVCTLIYIYMFIYIDPSSLNFFLLPRVRGNWGCLEYNVEFFFVKYF